MDLKVGDKIRIKYQYLNGYGSKIAGLHQSEGHIVVSRIRQCQTGPMVMCPQCTTDGMIAEFEDCDDLGYCFLSHEVYTLVNRIQHPKNFKQYYQEEIKRRQDKLWYDNATPMDRLKKKMGYIG